MRNLSPRTIETYWWHIHDYCRFHGKHPGDLGTTELRNYFHNMLTCGKYGPGSIKMGYYSLKFLYTQVLKLEWESQSLPTPKVPKLLPIVLSVEEVKEILYVIPNLKHRTIIMFMYATGVRVSECINMRVKDIDSQRSQVKVQMGKGRKQRYTQLSAYMLKMLRKYYREYRPKYWLFEGGKGHTSHIGETAVREILSKARYKTPKITKHYTPHTFRHSFATHHLEMGTNLLIIQRFLGHSDIKDTVKYLHVQQYSVDKLSNPLDELYNRED